MIPIQQLRVGSYWQLNTKTGQVFKIVTPCEIADAAEYGVGVELTPEVLEKCGFFYRNHSKDMMDNGFFTVYISDSIYFNSYPIVNIKYLHQLQNLFYCITGTELTYTP